MNSICFSSKFMLMDKQSHGAHKGNMFQESKRPLSSSNWSTMSTTKLADSRKPINKTHLYCTRCKSLLLGVQTYFIGKETTMYGRRRRGRPTRQLELLIGFPYLLEGAMHDCKISWSRIRISWGLMFILISVSLTFFYYLLLIARFCLSLHSHRSLRKKNKEEER